jgi:thiol-disulfide isomerase/thioredoxin
MRAPASRWALRLCLAWVACAAVHAATPSLRVTTLDGRPFDLAQHRGKWVVVNWWATWCVPCIKELPEISGFVSNHANKVAGIGLAFEDSDPADIVAFLERRPIAFPVARVDPLEPPKDFGAPVGLPTTIVIAPDGRIAKSFTGPITAKELDAVMASDQR